MQNSVILIVLLLLTALGYHLGRRRALHSVGGTQAIRHLHSLPSYYGLYVVLWAVIPALLVMLLWGLVQDTVLNELIISTLPPEMQSLPPERLGLLINDIHNLAVGNITSEAPSPAIKAAADHLRSLQAVADLARAVVVLAIATAGALFAWRAISPTMRARNRVESILKGLMVASAMVAILTTIGIVLSVLFESLRFFQKVPVTDFLFGLEWSPQIAIRSDQVGASGAFGAIPLLAGTLLISFIALVVAVPIGLMSAIYLAEYASPRLRAWAKPILEVLAGIPTVVYGFFAALTVAPFIRNLGESVGLDVSSESALAAGLVMGIMIIPFVSSLSDDVINAVPQSLRDASYGLGATQSETIRQVILPAALPGIMGGVLLAASRAIGETMIVVMAAGLSANLTINPLEAVTTVTVQIVTLLVGDQEFDSAKTLAAFALGLLLFLITLSLNIVALRIVRRYREQYE
ncbi:MAG: phosphate ABC transporter permease subunit PstC [Gammaproteobacteria bacterium]|nr:MAG: phosphate ABC transporter permease subunit PstC [Gammaproteobacteria bacterium]